VGHNLLTEVYRLTKKYLPAAGSRVPSNSSIPSSMHRGNHIIFCRGATGFIGRLSAGYDKHRSDYAKSLQATCRLQPGLCLVEIPQPGYVPRPGNSLRYVQPGPHFKLFEHPRAAQTWSGCRYRGFQAHGKRNRFRGPEGRDSKRKNSVETDADRQARGIGVQGYGVLAKAE